jgi:glycosyltransferase involved in cell wall biosynthesis
MLDLTLIIPAKSESESLPIFLEEIQVFKCKKIIIMEEDDYKTINSIKSFQDIKIYYQKNKGYGSAIIEGIKITDTEYFCIINADGSMDPIYLDKMIKKVKTNNLDFLFASRYENPGGGSDDDNLVTSLGNYLFTKIGNIFFQLNISDILFTYVLGRVSMFNMLKLSSNDFTLCVEMPIKAKRAGLKLSTIPSFERSRIGGRKKVNAFRDGLLILIKMIKMFFSK